MTICDPLPPPHMDKRGHFSDPLPMSTWTFMTPLSCIVIFSLTLYCDFLGQLNKMSNYFLEETKYFLQIWIFCFNLKTLFFTDIQRLLFLAIHVKVLTIFHINFVHVDISKTPFPPNVENRGHLTTPLPPSSCPRGY